MAKVNIGAELQSLPLGQMLSGPLTAAIEAQALSAVSSAEFINTVGMTDSGAGGGREAVMLDFSFKNHVVDTTTGTTVAKDTVLSVPLLAVIETPYISITDLSVSFEFKIRDVVSKANQFKLATGLDVAASQTLETEIGASIGLPQYNLGAKGSVKSTSQLKTNFNVSATYQRSARHDTDRSATLKMNMSARQSVPEGFQRVLAILNDAISAQADTGGATPTPAPSP